MAVTIRRTSNQYIVNVLGQSFPITFSYSGATWESIEVLVAGVLQSESNYSISPRAGGGYSIVFNAGHHPAVGDTV